MNSDQNDHRPLAELLNCSAASRLIEEAELQFLLKTFWMMFRFGWDGSSNSLAQLKAREQKLQRIKRLFLSFDLVTLIPGAALAWEPSVQLMRIIDSCFDLQNLSYSATRRGPKVIVRALLRIADVLEFTLVVRAALTGRKSTTIKINPDLEQLIIASVRLGRWEGKPMVLRLLLPELSNN
jgi:hypothetical protein